jgi:hypothetical protein
MKTVSVNYGKWDIKCIPDDGARISVLRYAGYDLLTKAPADFKPPSADYGEFEKRPVYGYDDCFPTVDACTHPTGNYQIRDHGQLCWLKWHVTSVDGRLICSADCDMPKIRFTRTLETGKDEINWKFNILNDSGGPIEFLMVVHPLMPLHEISCIMVPAFRSAALEGSSEKLNINNPSELNEFLLNSVKGSFVMLYLYDVNEGKVMLGFRNGVSLLMEYDPALFPTLGIWWNNSGYPDEEELRRSECAFEPISGINSNLEETYRNGRYLKLGAADTFDWNIRWRIC